MMGFYVNPLYHDKMNLESASDPTLYLRVLCERP
jgi:hypothetical protein